jgi:hypothetical protein
LPKAEVVAGAPNGPVVELFLNVDGVDVEPKTGAEGIDDDDALLKADEVEGKVDVEDASFFKSLLCFMACSNA